jgi:hypothetical protein
LFKSFFPDFVENPIGFDDHCSLLFKKTSSNLSFLVGDELVFIIQDILTTRSDYFRAMLVGSFKEAQVPMTVKSKIPLHGIDIDVFKMIIDWIYTMDIKRLNDPLSPSLLLDLENAYVAADMYMLSDLCNVVGKYLNHLLTAKTLARSTKLQRGLGASHWRRISFEPGCQNQTRSTRMTSKSMY